MKNRFILPFTALSVLCCLQLLITAGLLPPGMVLLQGVEQMPASTLLLVMFVVILLESIVYMGFYIPGQMIAVLLVIGANPDWGDVGALTVIMVLAATLGSAFNYLLGSTLTDMPRQKQAISFRQLLLAMIHINALAFFMFNQGLKRSGMGIVLWAGLLNLPYYLLMLVVTISFSQQIGALAENPLMLGVLVLGWLLYALYRDAQQPGTIVYRLLEGKKQFSDI